MIFFRADKEYSTGEPLIASSPNKIHDLSTLRTHIENDSIKNDPYISLTEDIGVAILKYSYGEKQTKNKKYRYNQTRSKILLVDYASIPASDVNEKIDTSKEDVYFLNEDVRLVVQGTNKKAKNFSTADKEVIAYSKISGERIHEIHPVLADILLCLESCKYNYKLHADELFNKVVEGICSGKYNFQSINDMFFRKNEEGELVCVDEFCGKKFNDIERKFIEKYYGERLNIVDTIDECIPEFKGMSIKEKQEYGSYIRTQLVKDMVTLFLSKEFSKTIDLEQFFIPSEEEISMSAIEKPTNYRVYRNVNMHCESPGGGEGGKDKKVPYGIKYFCDSQRKVVSIKCLYKDLTKKRGEKIFLSEKSLSRSPMKIRDCEIDSPVLEEALANNQEESLFSEEKLAKYGCDELGINNNGIPIEILAVEISEQSDGALKQAIEDSMTRFEEKGKNTKDSPINRLIRGIVNATLSSTSIVEYNGEYTVEREDLIKNSTDMFYRNISRMFGDSKEDIPKKERNGLDNFIKVAIKVADENGIDIKDIFNEEMGRITRENEEKVAEAEKILKEAKERFKRKEISTNDRKKAQRTFDARKENQSKDKIKISTARGRFYKKYNIDDSKDEI